MYDSFCYKIFAITKCILATLVHCHSRFVITDGLDKITKVGWGDFKHLIIPCMYWWLVRQMAWTEWHSIQGITSNFFNLCSMVGSMWDKKNKADRYWKSALFSIRYSVLGQQKIPAQQNKTWIIITLRVSFCNM